MISLHHSRLLRLACIASSALLFSSAGVRASEHTFNVKLESNEITESGNHKSEIVENTALSYAWKTEPELQTLILRSIQTSIKTDGKPTMTSAMSHDIFSMTSPDGKTKETTLENATPVMKSELEDTFGAPFFTQHLDKEGNETSREVTSKKGAKLAVKNGMLENAVLFHPLKPADKDTWSVETKLSMGNGGYATGKLTYTLFQREGLERYNVTGTLINEGDSLPNKPLTIKNAHYVVTGKVVYDPREKTWVSGELSMDVNKETRIKGKAVGETKGTITAAMEIEN